MCTFARLKSKGKDLEELVKLNKIYVDHDDDMVERIQRVNEINAENNVETCVCPECETM